MSKPDLPSSSTATPSPALISGARAPRPDEKNGRHYFFLSRDEFKRKIARNELLEWAVVHDEYYGTPRRYVEDALKHGFDVIMAIDVQGARSVRRKYPSAALVFVLPPWISPGRRSSCLRCPGCRCRRRTSGPGT